MKKYILPLLAVAALFASSCVKDEIYEGPSKIEKVTLSPEAPTSNESVTVSVATSGLQKLTSATLTYNGTAVNMTISGKNASGVIPALPDKTVVNVIIKVVNEANFETTVEKGYTVGNPPTDWTKVKLNELYGAGADNEKAIELYNGTDFDVDLAGVTLFKDKSEAAVWTGLKGEVIPAHGVFAIIGAKGTTDRGFTSGFSSKKSVIIELFAPDGTKLDTFQRGDDSAPWGDQSLSNNANSWSRVPDGTGKWLITEKTIGALNAPTGEPDETVVQ